MSNTNTLSAKERINALADENSFVEIGAAVKRRSTDFNMNEKDVPADGVVTGYGLVHGKPVYIYSQDAEALSGSVGEMHAKKIVHIYELAVKTGVPVIGLIDCAGMRVQESVDALDGFGKIYSCMTQASGVIPQITAILGNCGGGATVMSAMSDFTFIEKNNSKVFVNSPNTLENNYKEKLDTSAADFTSGTDMADFVCDGEEELLESIAELVSILPANNSEVACTEESMDELNRELSGFEGIVADPAAALEEIGDNNFFLEVKAGYAKEMVTGFICLDGMTIGAIANRTALIDDAGKKVESFDARLTTAGCNKATAFVNKCNAFNIPVLTLTNVEGYAATVGEEKTIAKAVASLTAAFAQSDVAKVNLITGNAYGSAYISMNSKHIGADMVFALPGANIGMMDAELAAKVMYPDADKKTIDAKADEFKNASDATAAAARGYVDSVIEPESVRKQLLYAFEMLFTKSECPVTKKNITI